MRRTMFMYAAAVCALLPATVTQAVELRRGSNGSYGQVALAKNDDASSNLLDMPFSINFYGTTYNKLYINNNGNVTFGSALSTFTPFALGSLNQAMIAPYWADVDTRCDSCGNVWVGSFAAGQMTVTWDNVGYFSNHSDKLNNFQMTLYAAPNGGSAGDFDIEFLYNKLEWTTGDASNGMNGLGGQPAVAGYTNGNGISYLQPGSFLSPGALNMANESNVGVDGQWVYNIRNAATPEQRGLSPNNPILPTGSAPNNGYTFTFNVGDTTTRYYIDPPVATGYDFDAGSNTFTSARFTSALDDSDGYQLFSGSTLLGTVMIGDIFNFVTPLSSFSLRGINPANMLVPGDPTAFVSGFTFGRAGSVTVTQTPFVENIDAVPEPTTWAFMILGFGALGAATRRTRARRKVLAAA